MTVANKNKVSSSSSPTKDIDLEAKIYVSFSPEGARERMDIHNSEAPADEERVVWDDLLVELSDNESLYRFVWDEGVDDYNVDPDEYIDFCIQQHLWGR